MRSRFPAPVLIRLSLCVAGLALVLLWHPAPASAQVEEALGGRLNAALFGASASLRWAYLIAFLAGLATSLTPCVYPLIPITVSLFGARDDEVTRPRALGLATCYVGGIAVMYSGLGVFFGLTGRAFGTFMASPAVILPIVLIFLAMAASMFGAFELGLPAEVQGRLAQVGGKGAAGAFLMGLVGGIIAAPCTGPPLAALLAFVSTQRSVVLGGSLLFVYAVGMGVLFFVIAGFALKLPRSGPWMEAVKSVFGVVMIVMALYFLRNVWAPLRGYGRHTAGFLAAQGGLLAAGALLGAIHLSFKAGAGQALRKAAGVALMCGGLFGGLAWLLAVPPAPAGAAKLHWLPDEAQAVAQAQAEHKPLLIDFAAEWCLPCKDLELKTFSDPRVVAALSRFVVAHIDCTDPDDKIDALKARYHADTLPTVVIKDSSGREVLHLKDFMPPERMLSALEGVR